MPGPRLIAIITALLLMSGIARGQAAYSLSDLEEIDRLINSKNCNGLWSFVQTRPGLLVGNDALARELRNFVQSTERGMLDCFAARNVAPVASDVALTPTPRTVY